MIECSKNRDLGCTKISVRSKIKELNYEIKDLKCVDLVKCDTKLWYQNTDFKKVVLAGIDELNAL